MPLLDDAREAVRLVRQGIDDLPDRIDRWALQRHQPVPMDENTPWCRWCRCAWPCAEVVEIDERRAARRT